MDSMTQIASALGVSTATVSKALNNKPGVSAERAKMIRQYAQMRGYRPSYMARSLLKGSTEMIGLCFRVELTSAWYATVAQNIQQKCHERGYYLNLVVTKGNLEEDKKALDFFRELRVGGVIIGPIWHLSEYNVLREQIMQHKGIVAFGLIEDIPVNSVKLDLYSAAQIAVEHLASKGHRKIGFFGLPIFELDKPILKTRYTGFCEKMRILGLDLRKEWIIPNIEVTQEKAYEAMRKLLDTHCSDELPTAWFCQNDVFAAKLINILHNKNIHVPKDIAIVGCDNLPLAELTTPTITSLGFDMEEYVEAIVDIICKSMEAKKQTSDEIFTFDNSLTKSFAPKLIVRESSG